MPFEAENHPDALICTYWTTIAPGKRLNVPVTLHLCQGYEGDIPELGHVHADIVAAYQHQFPKITIGEWLVDRLYTVLWQRSFPSIQCRADCRPFFIPASPGYRLLNGFRGVSVVGCP